MLSATEASVIKNMIQIVLSMHANFDRSLFIFLFMYVNMIRAIEVRLCSSVFNSISCVKRNTPFNINSKYFNRFESFESTKSANE